MGKEETSGSARSSHDRREYSKWEDIKQSSMAGMLEAKTERGVWCEIRLDKWHWLNYI